MAAESLQREIVISIKVTESKGLNEVQKALSRVRRLTYDKGAPRWQSTATRSSNFPTWRTSQPLRSRACSPRGNVTRFANDLSQTETADTTYRKKLYKTLQTLRAANH